MDEIYDVVVVGAGLAGLAAAGVAAGAGARVVVLEAHQPGGRAASAERDGYRLNQGPHALYLGGPAEAVLRELGVDYHGSPPAGPYYARKGDDVQLWPVSASTLARTGLVGVRGKVRLGATLRRIPRIDPAAHAHETAGAWIDGLELPDDAAAVLRSVTRVGTYSNAFDHLSADAAITQLQMATTHGVLYLDGGWQTLVDGLRAVAAGRGVEIRTHATVGRVSAGDGVEVEVDGAPVHARAVVVAAGGPEITARLLGIDGAWQDRVGPPSLVSVLDLGLTQPAARGILMGIDEPLYLSTHCPPATLAPAGRTLVSLGRYVAPGDTAPSDADKATLRAHAAAAGITDDTIEMSRFLYRMTAIAALPVPAAGGLAGRPAVAVPDRPGAFISGDWVGPVGLLSDASFASAAAAGKAAAAHAAAQMVSS
jgi:phytoene dehydrogenase-like protein